jgi:glycosyltransferase involved in cell wall biosynthesis
VSAIEALAAATPVVANRVGGVPDVVRDSIDGFLVERGDVEAAADRLATLAAEPDLRRRLGESGRARVRDRYSVARLVDDVDRLYRALLESKR